MGNICCGGKEEKSKSDSTFLVEGSHNIDDNRQEFDALRGTVITTTSAASNDALLYQDDNSNFKAPLESDSSNRIKDQHQQEQEEEQLRRQQMEEMEDMKCKLIVQSTGRAMVSVSHSNLSRRDRNTIYYSDQGFAAALAQHLEQKMSRHEQQPQPSTATWMVLPPVPKSTSSAKTTEVGTHEVTAVEESTEMTRRIHDILSQPYGYDPLMFHRCCSNMNNRSGNNDSITATGSTTSVTTSAATSGTPKLAPSNNKNNQHEQLHFLCEKIVLDHVVRPNQSEHLLDTKFIPPMIENLL